MFYHNLLKRGNNAETTHERQRAIKYRQVNVVGAMKRVSTISENRYLGLHHAAVTSNGCCANAVLHGSAS